jgi:hypothetical protein
MTTHIEGLANREGVATDEREARTKSFLVRLSPTENARVQAEARRLGISKSDYVRLMMRGQGPDLSSQLLTR